MSPRTGRPKAENPKNMSIKIRFDEETNQSLIEYCEKHNVSRTEAVRQGLQLLLSENK
ncbi:MAG: CopG family transcriptional regulator [Clostridiales bacterium 43-6]|nr:MAG: CopG family transcriptional regulator [Clostridiales bacterium 43-6]